MLLFHIEAEWASLAIIATAPLCLLCCLACRSVLACGCLQGYLSSVFILASYPVFNWRLQFQETVFAQIHKKGITKLAIYGEDSFRKKLMLPWALPEETLLLSSMDGDKPTLTFMLVNPYDKETIGSLVDFRQFRSAFGSMEGASLNKQYFSIDTSSYKLMHYSDLFK